MAKISEKSAKYAVRNALNNAAFSAREDWQSEIRNTLILRNNFTVNAIRVRKVAGSSTYGEIRKMESRVGSVAEYMDEVEEGETEHKKGKHGVPVPTGYAAGQYGARPTTRLVQAKHRIKNVQIARPASGSWVSRKQQNAAAIRVAQKSPKSAFAYLDLGKTKGVFQIYKRKKPKMVWNYSSGTVRMAPHKTLEPVVKRALRKFPSQMAKQVLHEMRKALASL